MADPERDFNRRRTRYLAYRVLILFHESTGRQLSNCATEVAGPALHKYHIPPLYGTIKRWLLPMLNFHPEDASSVHIVAANQQW